MASQKKNYYDDEIRQSIAKLSTEDKLDLIESLFNGMATAMNAYHYMNGKTSGEIDFLMNKEVEGIKALVKERISTTLITFKRPKGPTDDQFVNDATIDMNLILSELNKKKRKSRKNNKLQG